MHMNKTSFRKQVRFPTIPFQFPDLKPVRISMRLIKLVMTLFVPRVTEENRKLTIQSSLL